MAILALVVSLVGPWGMLVGCLWCGLIFLVGVLPLAAAAVGAIHYSSVLIFWAVLFLGHRLLSRKPYQYVPDAPKENLPSVDGELVEEENFETGSKETIRQKPELPR